MHLSAFNFLPNAYLNVQLRVLTETLSLDSGGLSIFDWWLAFSWS